MELEVVVARLETALTAEYPIDRSVFLCAEYCSQYNDERRLLLE